MHARASTYQYSVHIVIIIFDYATKPRVKFKTAMLQSDLFLIAGIWLWLEMNDLHNVVIKKKLASL